MPLGQAEARRQLRDFRLYMLIGGMPQAVETYIETNNFSDVDSVKRTIIELYENDFRKIDPSGKLSALYDAIPACLTGNKSRYSVSSVLTGNRAGDIMEKISELEDSGTVLVSYNTADPCAGMAQSIIPEKFKLFLSDTGLFVTLAFKDRSFTYNIIYEQLLNDRLRANPGYIYENIIAQTLSASGHKLYYHTFRNKESAHCYEVDFLIAEKNKICPLEVKSSGYNTHPSLDAFCEKYVSRISRKIMIYTKDFMRRGNMEYLPVYMAQFL